MKTISLCMGLFLVTLIPSGCERNSESSENEISTKRSEEVFLELDLEIFALELERQKIGKDPKEEKDIKRLEFIDARLTIIYDERRSYRIPMPKPPNPCEPNPIVDCPIFIGNIAHMLIQEKFSGFTFVLKDLISGKVLYELTNENYEVFEDGLLHIKTGFNNVDLPREVRVEVFKRGDDDKFDYSFTGTF